MIKVNESTEVLGLSILLLIARYLNYNVFKDNLLICYPLTERCTSEDIFNVTQVYFNQHKITDKIVEVFMLIAVNQCLTVTKV